MKDLHTPLKVPKTDAWRVGPYFFAKYPNMSILIQQFSTNAVKSQCIVHFRPQIGRTLYSAALKSGVASPRLPLMREVSAEG